jgi:hypothetical protein
MTDGQKIVRLEKREPLPPGHIPIQAPEPLMMTDQYIWSSIAIQVFMANYNLGINLQAQGLIPRAAVASPFETADNFMANMRKYIAEQQAEAEKNATT